MKTAHKNHPSTPSPQEKGFSLIVTITMMILLSLIAVGILSLSSTVLRGSQNGQSMAEARANARLALNLAIGELQKQAGPDTRVTACADVLEGSIANPHITGVWESWFIDPNDSPSSGEFSEAGKEAKLLSWLASGAPDTENISNSFVKNSLEDEVTLWGSGSLGNQVSDTDKVRASRITLSEERDAGGYAWAVLDEGVKARVNTLTYDNSDDSKQEKEIAGRSQLGSGVRATAESIEGLDGFAPNSFKDDPSNPDANTLAKSITFSNFALAAEQLADSDDDTLKSLFHDISLFSTGLLTDTARGGLRTDFSLFSAEANLPDLYSHETEDYVSLAGKGVYDTLLGISNSGESSSPRWNALHQFSRLHEDGVEEENNVPLISAAIPDDWEAAETTRTRGGTTTTISTDIPDQLVLMPTVAKVQMIFSLIGRDLYSQGLYETAPAQVDPTTPVLHNPQGDFFRNTRYHYDLHLLYTPVVILHNPYNVALEFRNMNIQFHHIPFAMQVFRNGVAQSTDLVPFETMFADNDTEGKDKVFGMALKTETRGSVGSVDFTMLPGEAILFSPYINPRLTYQSAVNDRGSGNWDIYVDDGKTADLEAIPGWRGDGIGYGCDWILGAKGIGEDANAGRWRSTMGLASSDNIHVEFAPFSTSSSDDKFLITMSAETDSGTSVVNAIEIDYDSAENLREKVLGSSSATVRYPEDGSVQGSELIDSSLTPIASLANPKPFAVVSLQGKTTYGGVDVNSFSPVDGRIAAKPWSFAHGSIGASSADLKTEHPAAHSHEIDIQPLTLNDGTGRIIEVDAGGRGNFITGHSSFNGSNFGVAYEIPITPLQSLATLNGANPGGFTSQLPRFAAPIGNSWAHPLLSPDRLLEPSAQGYEMYDHSFLMNLALYDRFYFSGLGSQTGAFGNGSSVARSLQQFAEEGSTGDLRLSLYQPDSRSTDEFENLAGKANAHEEIAAWQVMNGAFNVNSTSVNAWKAMLSSIEAPDAQMNELSEADELSAFDDLGETGADTTRISRFRVPLSRSQDDGGPENLAYWLGPREYSENQIQLLAEKIVEQVKLRGPFLSLAEFVNRQLGSGSLAQKGALQAAIDQANLNDEFMENSQAGYNIPESRVAGYGFSNPEAAAGSSAQGAPGYLTQADLLTVLGNAATARSDTFTIRGYGESRDKAGNIVASAVCEAVVQRYPEWMDSADSVEAKPSELTSETNERFGRRFRTISFRWLAEGEV